MYCLTKELKRIIDDVDEEYDKRQSLLHLMNLLYVQQDVRRSVHTSRFGGWFVHRPAFCLKIP